MARIPKNAELVLTVTGQHRSKALAVRHLKRLEKEYPAQEFLVRIAWRQNAKGFLSARGRFFTFQVWRRIEEVEYEGAFDS